jgi:hypothetical protein
MMLLNRVPLFRVLPEDSTQSTSLKNWIPCSRPNIVIYRPDAQLFKATSVRKKRTFHPDLPLCWEASNFSSLHPSGRFSNTSGRHSVFDLLWDFLPKHRYGKIVATVRTMWIPVRMRSSIRQVGHSKSRCPDANLHGPDARAIYMEIACSWSTTIRTTGQHCLDAAQIRKEFQQSFGKPIAQLSIRTPYVYRPYGA